MEFTIFKKTLHEKKGDFTMLKLFKTKRDPEDPKVEWVCILPFLRLKFEEGRYAGWYNPLKMTKM